MTADLLSTPSRIFYEHSKFRMFLSIVFAGISLSFLGFAAIGKKIYYNHITIL